MTTRQEFETGFSKTGESIDKLLADTRETMREERQTLKDKWIALDTKRKGVADDTEETWNGVKAEMEEGWKDIKDSYEDIKKNFSSDSHAGHGH